MATIRVLVTGVDGYIGAVLGARLLKQGFEVVGVDCGFYRDGWLYNDHRPRPLTFTNDVRRITPKDVEGFDAVVHRSRRASGRALGRPGVAPAATQRGLRKQQQFCP